MVGTVQMGEKMELSEKQAEEGLVDEAQALLAKVRTIAALYIAIDQLKTSQVQARVSVLLVGLASTHGYAGSSFK